MKKKQSDIKENHDFLVGNLHQPLWMVTRHYLQTKHFDPTTLGLKCSCWFLTHHSEVLEPPPYSDKKKKTTTISTPWVRIHPDHHQRTEQMLLPTSSGRIKISFPLCSYLRSLEKIEIHLTERRPSQVRVSLLKGVSFRSSLFDWNQVKQSVFSSLEQSSSPAPAGLGCLQLCLLVMILLIFFWLYRCQDCYNGK